MRVIHVVPAVAEEASGPSYSVSACVRPSLRRGRMRSWRRSTGVPGVDSAPYLTTFPLGLGRGDSVRHRRCTAGCRAGCIRASRPHSQSRPVDDAQRLSREGVSTIFELPAHCVTPWNTLALGARIPPATEVALLASPPGASCTLGRLLPCDGEGEYQDIRRRGFTQPICILPTASTCHH